MALSEEDKAEIAAMLPERGLSDEQIRGSFSTLINSIQGMESRLGQMVNQPPAKAQDDVVVTPKDEDLEQMSRADYTEFLIGKMQDTIKPIAQAITKDRNERTTQNIKAQINQTREEFVDFDKWAPEIKEHLKKNPTNSVQEAYTLVRAADKEKATQIDEELNKEKEKEEQEKEEANVVEAAFGGLTPTSSMTSSSKGDPMTSSEAAEAAWDTSGIEEHLAEIASAN